jgi:hypothetical protein
VYSKYNIGVFQVRCGVECDITCWVNIIVTVRYSTVQYNETQPAKATVYRNSPRTRNEYEKNSVTKNSEWLEIPKDHNSQPPQRQTQVESM